MSVTIRANKIVKKLLKNAGDKAMDSGVATEFVREALLEDRRYALRIINKYLNAAELIEESPHEQWFIDMKKELNLFKEGE